MKNFFTLLSLIITITTFAQAPQGFNYQATVRNSSGNLIASQTVEFIFNIMLDSASSTPVFSETQSVLTDDLGQVNLVIGTGTATTGNFSSINWATGTYFLGIELKVSPSSPYVAMGTTKLLSVPYALYANSSGNPIAPTPNLASVLTVNNGANNLQIKNLADPTDAQDAVTKSYSETQLQVQVAQLQAQITALVNATAAPLPNVTIGTQIWSSTNMDVITYRDGTPIPQVTDPTAWLNLTTGAWCYYNNDPANGAIYGKLYNWYAVAGIHDAASLNDASLRKQFAPIGWHVPSDTEWSTLINYLDPNANGGDTNPNVAGGKMKEAGITHWISPNTDATNSSGFTGLPGGFSGTSTNFIGERGRWWTLTDDGASTAWYRFLSYNFGTAFRNHQNKYACFSVRCLRD